MKNKIIEAINKHERNIVEEIIKLVNINTVLNESKINSKNPFGEGISNVFKIISKKAENDGFNTTNLDNYAMDISLGEKSKDYIGILVHADTVPADPTSFSFDPFKGTYDGEYIYGRGTQDDKGPLVGIYYALKIIKELNIELKREVRIIIGGNEENHHLGINKYFENNNYPVCSFTADNEFPLINIELGGSIGIGRISLKDKNIKYFKGGEVVNAVAEFAEAKFTSSEDVNNIMKEYCSINNIKGKLHTEKNEHIIKFRGKPSHGSLPENGISAITHLANFLMNFSNDESLKFIVDKFHEKFYGEGFDLKVDENNASITGQTSSSIGMVFYKEGILEIHQDIRFTSLHKEEEIKDKIIKGYKTIEGNVNVTKLSKPLYMEEDKPLVKLLMKAYKDVTGFKKAKPLISGGGTYAKNVPNCLAFGAMFPGEEQRMHNIDERINLESLKKAIEIYINAIINLANHKWI